MSAAVSSAPPDIGGEPATGSRIGGVVIPVRDLAASRAFYAEIFRGALGEWIEGPSSLTFRGPEQRVELVRRASPRTFGVSGPHCGFRVPTALLEPTADALRGMGHEVHWWREDHPSERQPTAYATDPSGNLVQLATSDSGGLVSHVTLAVHDLELAEKFYRAALGGVVDHYQGWRTDDIVEAGASDGEPCAPWTRAARYSRIRHESVTRPTPQLYIRYDDVMLGLVVATRHIQEPPEETLKGTPRMIVRTERSVRLVSEEFPTLRIATGWHLENARGVAFRRERQTLFFRDRSGNFLQLDCAS